MSSSSYIPAPDPAFDSWLANFSTLITAAPTDYGLVSGDAVIIQAANDDWNALYVISSTPSTRTSPAIAATQAQRILSTAIVRPYAQSIARNPSVSNDLKVGLGLNLPNPTRPRIPAPLTVPGLSLVSAIHFLHTLAYRDTSTPTSKAKPFGAIGVKLLRIVNTTAQTDPTLAPVVGIYTKSPLNVGYGSGDVGKVATYWSQWTTASGPGGVSQDGPISAPLSVTVI